MRRTLSFIIILLLFLPMGAAQNQGSSSVFKLSQDHEMTAFASTKLTWKEGQSEIVSLNVTMTDYRVNNSKIVIQVIQFLTVDASQGGAPESQGLNATEETLTPGTPSILYQESVSPPQAADRFYLNISIIAYPTGGGADETPNTYSFRYPDTGSIIVQRDNLVPVVDLYGFPSGSFFGFWLPIYSFFMVLMLSPSIVVLISRIRKRIQDESEDPVIPKEDPRISKDQVEEES